MAGFEGTPDYVITQDEFIRRFKHSLKAIDTRLPGLIDFNLQIQKNNLMSLVAEATDRIKSYDQIYPYIKEIRV